MEQSREKLPLLHLYLVAIEKETFESLSTRVGQLMKYLTSFISISGGKVKKLSVKKYFSDVLTNTTKLETSFINQPLQT